MHRLLLVCTICALAGCDLGVHILADPQGDAVLQIESGDRVYFVLEENSAGGWYWEASCTDPDVEVTIDHQPPEDLGAPGHAKVRVRIHRGYDGPSTVYYRLVKQRTGRVARTFAQGLVRRTGDAAFWK